jgi:very-short-patch-repair endonuclease
MTVQEWKLWYLFLSKYPIRFQRQKTIGSFIVDFFCSKAMLAVEIDGRQHHTKQGEAYDLERAAHLDSLNIEIIRFDNQAVENDFNSVCNEIDEIVYKKVNKQFLI